MERCAACGGYTPRDTVFCPACGHCQEESRAWDPPWAQPQVVDRVPIRAPRATQALAVVLILTGILSVAGWWQAEATRARATAELVSQRERLDAMEAELTHRAAEIAELTMALTDQTACVEGATLTASHVGELGQALLAAYEQSTDDGELGEIRRQREAALLAIVDYYYQGFRAAWDRSYEYASDWIEAGNEQARLARQWESRYATDRATLDEWVARVADDLVALDSGLGDAGCGGLSGG